MLATLDVTGIRLVPVEAGDLERICALLLQQGVRRYLCDDALLPRADVEASIRRSLDPSSSDEMWLIETTADGAVGLCALQPPLATTLRLRNIGWRSRELIIALEPAHWGRGLARAAIDAMAEHAGQDGVTFALVASVDEPNFRSHALMRASGFQELGRVQGPVHPLVVYERAV